jgi:hypothetical protein
MAAQITLHCILINEERLFSVRILPSESIYDLKKKIKAERPIALADIDASDLKVWGVSISPPHNHGLGIRANEEIAHKKPLKSMDKINKHFSFCERKDVHVIVKRSDGQSFTYVVRVIYPQLTTAFTTEISYAYSSTLMFLMTHFGRNLVVFCHYSPTPLLVITLESITSSSSTRW